MAQMASVSNPLSMCCQNFIRGDQKHVEDSSCLVVIAQLSKYGYCQVPQAYRPPTGQLGNIIIT